jgi:outer membrane protein assembly factor BamA
VRICFLPILIPLILAAQPPPPATSFGTDETRADEIRKAEQAKAASIEPAKETPNPFTVIEKGLGVWNGMKAGAHGLSLHLGGLAVGSGLALGPEYIYKTGDLYNPNLIWDSYAVASLQTYYRMQSSIEAPRLFHEHAFAYLEGVRFDYPRLAYYGPGPDSKKTGRTDYRMQDNYADFRAGFKAPSRFRIGILGGFQNVRIGSGTAPQYASTDATYTIDEAPGLDRKANFWNGGFFLRFDSRDNPGDAGSGTYLFSQFEVVEGSRRRLGAFNEYDFEAQHYFHFWNRRRVVATRFKTSLTTPKPGTFVPFYLQPRLGGQDDLRGFRPYRFYDQNSVLVQGEYRWTVMQPLEVALFGDGGKVFHDWQNFSLAGLEADAGIGLRVRRNEFVPFRLDVGFSREGVQVWAIFYNAF